MRAGGRPSVAVLGAGMAGLTAARILAGKGHEVTVLEKSRGPGGRMSTRREGGYRFDHGAQYFTTRDPRFLRQVVVWRERGLVTDWQARIGVLGDGSANPETSETRRLVAVPGMNALCRSMADDVAGSHGGTVRYGWRAAGARFEDHRWTIEAGDGEVVSAETMIITAPPEQARELLGDAVPVAMTGVDLRPCWAVMAVFDAPLLGDLDAAFVNTGPLSWVASQAARPGRPDARAWVLHATPGWSEENLGREPDRVCERLTDAARALPGAAAVAVSFARAHRWRYSIAREPLEVGALWVPERRLVIAGDWCAGSRVEGAFLSGAAAAGRIMGSIVERGT